MSRNILERVPALALTASLVACSSSAPERESMANFEYAELACVQVEGSEKGENLPEFTEQSCEELAERVQQGFEAFSELTDGAVTAPRVRPRLLPDVVKVDDALATRCIDYGEADRSEKNKLKTMVVEKITMAAMEQISVDYNTTTLVVAANASPSLCQEQQSLNLTERCPDKKGRLAVLAGQALHDLLDKPVIFMFETPDESLSRYDTFLAAHERGHQIELGHEFPLCNLNGDRLPSQIERDQTGLSLYLFAQNGSVMSYAHTIPTYLAPPHAAQMGLIEQERIISPETPGVIVLSDPSRPHMGPVAPGEERAASAAALQLELENPAIKELISAEVVKTDLSVDDYELFIGKIAGRAEVGVYASPSVELLQKHAENTSIFLLYKLSAEPETKELDIADGPKITVVSGDKNAVIINLQRTS